MSYPKEVILLIAKNLVDKHQILALQRFSIVNKHFNHVINTYLFPYIDTYGYLLGREMMQLLIKTQNVRRVMVPNGMYVVKIEKLNHTTLHVSRKHMLIYDKYIWCVYANGTINIHIQYTSRIKNPKKYTKAGTLSGIVYDRDADVIIQIASNINTPFLRRGDQGLMYKPNCTLLEWKENDYVTGTVSGFRENILENIITGISWQLCTRKI